MASETQEYRNSRSEERGAAALAAYMNDTGYHGDDLETVTDLITDLLHYLAATDTDGGDAPRSARTSAWCNYIEEREAPDDLA